MASPPSPPVAAPSPFVSVPPVKNSFATIPQPIPVPNIEKIKTPSQSIPMIGIVAVAGVLLLLIIGGIGWSLMSANSASNNSQFTAAEQTQLPDAGVTPKNDIPLKKSDGNDLYSKDTIAKQVDALIDERNAEINERNAKYRSISSTYPTSPSVDLSSSEKRTIVAYFFLLQKMTGKKHSKSELSLVLTFLLLDLPQLRRLNPTNSIDVYVVNKKHIEAQNATYSRVRREYIDAMRDKRDSLHISMLKSECERYETRLKLLKSILPESNRLSANAHDAEEQKRLDVIQREKDKIERENKAKALF